jgi:hypothetical protein
MIRTIAITLFSNADDEPGRRFGSRPLPETIKYDLYPVLGQAPDLQAKL